MNSELNKFLEQKEVVVVPQDDKQKAKHLWIQSVNQLFQTIDTWLKPYQENNLLHVKYQQHQMLDHQYLVYELDQFMISLKDSSHITFTPLDGKPEAVFGMINIKGPYAEDLLYLASPQTALGKTSVCYDPTLGEPVTSYLFKTTSPGPALSLEETWQQLQWQIVCSRSEGRLELFTPSHLENLIMKMTDDSQVPTIEQQAIHLARSNKQVEPGILKVYWFSNDEEIRLVEIEENIFPNTSGKIEPFYFRASPLDQLFKPSLIALIRPDEVGKLQLTTEWGTWNDAQELSV